MTTRYNSVRSAAYGKLRELKEFGVIERYIASQFPNRLWGFRVTMHDGSEFMFLPKEAIAFAEGVKVGNDFAQ